MPERQGPDPHNPSQPYNCTTCSRGTLEAQHLMCMWCLRETRLQWIALGIGPHLEVHEGDDTAGMDRHGQPAVPHSPGGPARLME